MKTILLTALVLMISFLNSGRANAAGNFPVSVGGASYSQVIGRDTNSCDQTLNDAAPSSACTDEKSDAQKACAQIGGRLPSLEDYSALLRSMKALGDDLVVERPFFQSGTIPALTNDGVKKFQELFGLADSSLNLWTSSYHISMPDERAMSNAWVLYIDRFRGQSSGFFSAGRTFTANAVICIEN